MNRDNTVRQAGGFIVQLMPFAEEEMISKLEENIKNLSSVTTMLDAGKTPEGLSLIHIYRMNKQITENKFFTRKFVPAQGTKVSESLQVLRKAWLLT